MPHRDETAQIIALHASQQIPDPEPIPDTAETARFCPVSLADWLALSTTAGVPHVPAQLVTTLNRCDCAMFDQPGPHQERLGLAFADMQNASKPNHMMRFDFCSSSETKYRLANGLHQWDPAVRELTIDDPRVFDIMMEFPKERIPVWQRPWIDAAILDGYPVEYRVFVNDGRIAGISNYYPQRPLPRDDQQIQRVRELTHQLISAAQPPFLWNTGLLSRHFHETRDPDNVHFTADYIVASDDEVLFLEGGTPHELGAHPCCFEPGLIDGIALASRNHDHQTR